MICGMLDNDDSLRLLTGTGNTTDTRGRSGGFGLIGSVWVLSLESNQKGYQTNQNMANHSVAMKSIKFDRKTVHLYLKQQKLALSRTHYFIFCHQYDFFYVPRRLPMIIGFWKRFDVSKGKHGYII